LLIAIISSIRHFIFTLRFQASPFRRFHYFRYFHIFHFDISILIYWCRFRHIDADIISFSRHDYYFITLSFHIFIDYFIIFADDFAISLDTLSSYARFIFDFH
jgi:hypothetical protein